jgi:group I intron endonuclease
MKPIHCIYRITNTQNGKYYVGRTKDFKGRKRRHFSCLRAGKHWNPNLQNSFNKWGEGCFRMDVEVTGLTKPQAKELEQLCLDEVVGMPRCYNISKNADTRGGVPLTEDTKQKQREALGRHFTCTYPDGRVKHYLSTREAADELGVGKNTIMRYLKGLVIPGRSHLTAHLRGCIFQYVD